MKKLSIGLALMALALGAFAGDLKSEIEAVNKKVHAAFMKKDVKAFEAALKDRVTADFKHVENGVSQDFKTMCEQMKQGFAMAKKVIGSDTKVLSVKESGNSATATVVHKMTMIMTGPDKKDHKYEFSGTSTDQYKKIGGKWKMASMTWKEQKLLMDGKPMDMSKMGG